MVINEVKYVGSYPSVHKCPTDIRPEYAFIGRSNVGKSSLINMITSRKEVAKVSKTPGKTQMLNYFDVNKKWYLVDLPGYGFAKISKKQRAKWEIMIEKFLITRATLQCAFVLLDARHELQAIDRDFMNWMGERSVPFVIIYTKIDKLKNQGLVEKNIKKIQEGILEYWNTLPQEFITSSKSQHGREEILAFIHTLNEQFFEANKLKS